MSGAATRPLELLVASAGVRPPMASRWRLARIGFPIAFDPPCPSSSWARPRATADAPGTARPLRAAAVLRSLYPAGHPLREPAGTGDMPARRAWTTRHWRHRLAGPRARSGRQPCQSARHRRHQRAAARAGWMPVGSEADAPDAAALSPRGGVRDRRRHRERHAGRPGRGTRRPAAAGHPPCPVRRRSRRVRPHRRPSVDRAEDRPPPPARLRQASRSTGSDRCCRTGRRSRPASARNAESTDDGAFGGVVRALPALAGSREIQERASTLGWDWERIDGVWEKVGEEIDELRAAAPRRGTAPRARRRAVRHRQPGTLDEARPRGVAARGEPPMGGALPPVEALAAARGVDLGQLSLAEKDVLWDEVKRR